MTTITCRRCLYSTGHPLGLVIDNDGICSGCRVHEEKNTLDWRYRWDLLEKLIEPYRSKDTRHYDCIVPVTGAQDSYYIVHLVKNRLGLNPLLVSYNKYWNTPVGIRNLANLRIKFNCDLVMQNVNPLSVKKITKETLRRFKSLYWHCIAGHTAFPVQTAVRYRIPLIIWGAHQGIEQVGMFSHEHEVEMTRRYRKEHDLMGFEADDLVTYFNSLTEADIWQYRYPDDDAINAVGVKGIYLGNYVRWDPYFQHKEMVSTYGYEGAIFSRTFDRYDHVDCFNYMNLHDRIKVAKCGFGKVMDQVCREIRHGRMSRDQGESLVNQFEQGNSEYEDLFCQWLGVDRQSLNFMIDREFPGLDESVSQNKVGFQASGEPVLSNLDDGTGLGYVTIGKGYSL